jgi:hypothetical protein
VNGVKRTPLISVRTGILKRVLTGVSTGFVAIVSRKSGSNGLKMTEKMTDFIDR